MKIHKANAIEESNYRHIKDTKGSRVICTMSLFLLKCSSSLMLRSGNLGGIHGLAAYPLEGKQPWHGGSNL